MTGVALQSLFNVFLVIEGNGLPGFEALAEGDAEEKQDNADQDSNEEIFHFPISANPLLRPGKITTKEAGQSCRT
jgi:hypothetical protein